MEFSEQVLILQSGKFREADMWVRLLSPSKGLLSAFAFGGSRSKQRFIGCLDVFSRVLFRIKSSHKSEYLALQEGVLVQGTSRLRTDWLRLGIANNCAKFIQAFGVTPDGAIKAYSLLTDLLDYLEESDTVSPQLPLYFRARVAFDQGYATDFSSCNHCSCTPRQLHFIVREGLTACPSCLKFFSGYSVILSEETRMALSRVQSDPLSEWGSIDGNEISTEAKRECAKAIDGFVQFHIGLQWNNGRFSRV